MYAVNNQPRRLFFEQCRVFLSQARISLVCCPQCVENTVEEGGTPERQVY